MHKYKLFKRNIFKNLRNRTNFADIFKDNALYFCIGFNNFPCIDGLWAPFSKDIWSVLGRAFRTAGLRDIIFDDYMERFVFSCSVKY